MYLFFLIFLTHICNCLAIIVMVWLVEIFMLIFYWFFYNLTCLCLRIQNYCFSKVILIYTLCGTDWNNYNINRSHHHGDWINNVTHAIHDNDYLHMSFVNLARRSELIMTLLLNMNMKIRAEHESAIICIIIQGQDLSQGPFQFQMDSFATKHVALKSGSDTLLLFSNK